MRNSNKCHLVFTQLQLFLSTLIRHEALSPGQTESQLNASLNFGSTCDSVWPGLAYTCVDLRWLAHTLVGAHFGRDQICTQVDASCSPFGHPTQVNASCLTSINVQWNPDFSNPQFPEPPDISNQTLFPLDLLHSSSIISPPIARTLDFSKLPITRTNFGSRGTNWPSITRTCENLQTT